MKRIPLHQIWYFVFVLSGAVFVFIARSTFNEYILSIINFVGIYIILAVSLNITNGFTGLFSLGHPGFMAIGGYMTSVLTFPVAKKAMFLELPGWLSHLALPFLPALLIGGVCASLTAFVIGVPVLRLRGHYLAVATLGFLIIVQVLITNWESVTRGPLGMNGLPALTHLWWVYAWVVITLYVSWKIKFSSYGRSMLAIREDPLAAQCVGTRLFRTRVVSLALGAFFAGIAGGLWAHLVTAITPASFSLVLAFHIVVMVVVGGSGSISGAFVAAVLFSTITELFRPLEESLDAYGIGEILMALILILILIYRPTGIFGTREPGFLTAKST
ncbi:MAG: branched-chain amino acid ABC transporter permease [Deltaproteobacteria bacterium]|nr:branched-chain amino acid ABC transporter permease [Deltaproteobacteria bacterium]MBW1956186.1 branched-chain amino acid ABC transporter permease [Deltaproteobacteria bacterium]MBW2042957.1 branched-chain amino acid ABC transporter permease [Deltaproteobacteria bacterium]MBW2132544.1 branched-chain amino acid ABC transporter permease [Deltaproteobacteria bacterium]